MEAISNINTLLAGKITSALLEKGYITTSILRNLENKIAEGKAKESDWITAFNEKFNSTLMSTDETK
jgi:hypothetical protein